MTPFRSFLSFSFFLNWIDHLCAIFELFSFRTDIKTWPFTTIICNFVYSFKRHGKSTQNIIFNPLNPTIYAYFIDAPIIPTGEGLLYVHRAISLPAETLTASHTYTITCTTETNEPATVVWSKNNKQIFINDANFEPQPSECICFVTLWNRFVSGISQSLH